MLAILLLLAQTFTDDAVTLPPVDGWTRQEAANKSVAFVPPGIAPEVRAALILVPSEASTDAAAEYHAKSLKAATNGLKILETMKTGERGAFRYSNLALEIPGGKKAWVAIYTTRWAGRGQTGVFFCDDESTWHFSLGRVEVTFMNTAVPRLHLAPGAEAVPIVNLYFSAAFELGTTLEGGRAVTKTLPRKKYLAFYKNGLALRVDAFQSGEFGSTYHAFGLADFDAEALLKEPKDDRVGKWTETDGKITVAWTVGNPETYARDGAALDGSRHWTRIATHDGARLDGMFVCKNQFTASWTLQLTKEGRFRADGVHKALGGGATPLFPEKGSGSYEIRARSLILRFENGYRTSIALQITGDDPAKASQIILNGTPFDQTVK